MAGSGRSAHPTKNTVKKIHDNTSTLHIYHTVQEKRNSYHVTAGPSHTAITRTPSNTPPPPSLSSSTNASFLPHHSIFSSSSKRTSTHRRAPAHTISTEGLPLGALLFLFCILFFQSGREAMIIIVRVSETENNTAQQAVPGGTWGGRRGWGKVGWG